MCGIAALIHHKSNSFNSERVKNVLKEIKHRGPDAEGVYISEKVGLIHTRLSILDQNARANQPMTNEAGNLHLIFNGFISNYRELRIQLQEKGSNFKTNSDTEVILRAWEKFGPKSVEKFHGMFAFIILDEKAQKIFIVRDRLGIKPIYFYEKNGQIVVASEIRAILTAISEKPSLNLNAVYEYFNFQNNFTGETMFEGIKELDPGTIRTISLTTFAWTDYLYWDLDYSERYEDRFEDAVENVKTLLFESIDKNLNTDTKIGSYLSSGIDSGLISAFAAKKILDFQTFTIGFDVVGMDKVESFWDESDMALEIAKKIASKHTNFMVGPDLMEKGIFKVLNILHDPKMGQSYPNYFAAEIASREVKVVLSGTGGDEIFCGYPWRYKIEEKNQNLANVYYKSWQRICSEPELSRIFKGKEKKTFDNNAKKSFDQIWEKSKNQKNPTFLEMQLYFEAKTFLRGLLNIEDKISMHFGLESRYPYLDHNLVDYVTGLNKNFMVKQDKNKVQVDFNSLLMKAQISDQYNKNGKLLLREIAKEYLPLNIAQLTKKGFSAPDATWFRQQSRDFIVRILSNKEDMMYEILDYNEVQKILYEHISGKSNRRLFIWNLLNFSAVLKKYFTL